MIFLEQRIKEYKNNCGEDFRGILNKKCKLTGDELLEIENLAHLAHLHKNKLLSGALSTEFEDKIKNIKTQLSIDDLIDLLISTY
ncbi:hypothetical protein [Aquimarina algiphila]|nr:hypothetical protein [Aquimarina algiphila]